jgi:ABC-2 type transport system permease protein
MGKIWLILKSEFGRRVRSKAFILATLLVPIFLVGAMVAPGLLAYFGEQSNQQTVAVVDETGRLTDRLQRLAGDDGSFTFTATDAPVDSVRAAVRAGTYDGYLLLPEGLLGDAPGAATLYSMEGGGGLSGPVRLSGLIDRAVQEERLAARNVPEDIQAIMDVRVSLDTRKLTEEGTAADSTIALSAIGFLMAFAIYFAVVIYGQYVMQGVIEEKSNRVVEIVVSSVRPFELLMGKVLGIGAMGLAQMLVWVSVAGAGLTFAAPIAALFLDPSDLGVSDDASAQAMVEAAGISVPTVPVDLVLWFLLFFLGGYLLYASLFAAVGSAVEQQQDAQNLLYPVLIPLFVPILFATYVLETPAATLSVVLSLVPFFAPVLMPLRAAVTTVPVWQLGLSFALLALTFVAMIWVAGRIYRVGIFMYGKTPGFREILRWATYRQ